MNAKPSALKGVKLRREAEEADKAYREAVFHLESLRLRKNKILVAANNVSKRFSKDVLPAVPLTRVSVHFIEPGFVYRRTLR